MAARLTISAADERGVTVCSSGRGLDDAGAEDVRGDCDRGGAGGDANRRASVRVGVGMARG
ncbi:hypothetical protein GCM10023259_097380 [Thermocatellispora tengchongensis]